jgi:subtilisin family serine protease
MLYNKKMKQVFLIVILLNIAASNVKAQVAPIPIQSKANRTPVRNTKHDWQDLDLKTDSLFGISLDKAYNELLIHKVLKPVLVAVIDGGVDVDHEALKGLIWEDRKSISDHNGHNFLINMNFDPAHGTHVAGIIAHTTKNNCMIMPLITLAADDGDEPDVYDAKAIRYAVDHRAKIINISYGKSTSTNKKLVDEAVKYAMRKGVMIIHAAGNDKLNEDSTVVYPSGKYLDGKKANAWIEVGASFPWDNNKLPAFFSNYGAQTVDLYAPGIDIWSCVPVNKYEMHSGTSMAAPIVAGVAALIMEVYPNLKASQVKDIMMRSVCKRNSLKDKSISGGVLNAYSALKLAATYR